MASKTNIEWTDYNWNFLRGCSRVSEGCRNCYAETIAARFSGFDINGKQLPYFGLAEMVNGNPRWTGEISFHEDILLQPLRWTRPRKVFVNSMSDLFHEKVTDEMLDKAFRVMFQASQHTFQILTKRPERMLKYVGDRWECGKGFPWEPARNIWLGVSVEDQKTADERIPLLLQTPAAVRWISAEPLLGPIDLNEVEVPAEHDQLRRPWDIEGYKFSSLTAQHEDRFHQAPAIIDWVVVGGES
jgi:protein gp37